MKAFCPLFAGFLLIAGLPSTASAQASYGAEAYAQRQQEEERWRRMSAQMEELLNKQEDMRRRITTLEEENRALRSEVTRAGNSGVSPEEFQRVTKQLADKLKEVDDKRVADNKAVLEEMKRLVRDLKPTAAAPAPSVPRASDPLPATQEGYTHVMQEGQTISAVVQAFRAQGINTSVDAILKANPKIDPRRLKVGQEIFIPKP
jgi:Skp family chaperone for outer membrane proteins